MKTILFLAFFIVSIPISAKEYKSLKAYEKSTQKETLSPSDWLKSDRKKNTLVWQKANVYNLKNNLSKEYLTIKQRRDFYVWYISEIEKKGHQVVWPRMALFISQKIKTMNSFPVNIFVRKSVKEYGEDGSIIVFNNVFLDLLALYKSDETLKNDAALNWDKKILHKEQFTWIASLYKTMSSKKIKRIERVAKGKFLFSLFVPKEIRFQGKIELAKDRYKYALDRLRAYCKD
ncbi:Insecticidal toxin complex protein [Tenacibaculum todarodis]|uniref:Insecticidal toxin complex protein n=1 Tax=Tenacibaculum todarodis TaxID=1850252 RepID=A0A1L3JH12_9FLAO|nr:Insecticidal toxin complex protein [Tenacibaculum todarodis]APG64407.1 Insecticidal toxin complex protein [Tenacibaculum todarodis]